MLLSVAILRASVPSASFNIVKDSQHCRDDHERAGKAQDESRFASSGFGNKEIQMNNWPAEVVSVRLTIAFV